ncbi:hypothetical protein DSO57_1012554 [Entomophthora muscae]|uniref:Uncharacterized protein n=1 Tax=Entomophthora muscae TaxID=34485 RepID=A0ACC2TGU0_9FUNG|nr:hypothetical protein DSO57_1012554 [Entomophthora muscae]
MMAHLGLFASVFEILAFVIVKVAIDSMAATWPALYMAMPSDSFSNLPLQVTCLLKILTFIFCYTATGLKMSKTSSQFGLLLFKQLMSLPAWPVLSQFLMGQLSKDCSLTSYTKLTRCVTVKIKIKCSTKIALTIQRILQLPAQPLIYCPFFQGFPLKIVSL